MLSGTVGVFPEDATLTDARAVAEAAARSYALPHLLIRPGSFGRVVVESFTPENDPNRNFSVTAADAVESLRKLVGQVGLIVAPDLPEELREPIEQIVIAATCTGGTA